jgi:signal transduction histidine kinase
MHLFLSARFKLTAWYVLIIMIINGVLSSIAYAVVAREININFDQIEERLAFEEERLPPSLRQEVRLKRILTQQDRMVLKQRFLILFVEVNGGVWVIVAILAYYLAGKSLRPIEQMVEDQKRFVGDASHELRTPLAALKAANEVALRDLHLTKREAVETLHDNLGQIDRMHALVNTLLALVRAGDAQLHMEWVDMVKVVAEVVELMQPLAVKKGVKLMGVPSSGAIMANRPLVVELLTILIDNSIKYTRRGGTVSFKTSLSRGKWRLVVEDTGSGIPKDDLGHVFDRFYRADAARTSEGMSGFGLGLAMAKRIVELHEGTLALFSEETMGTVVKVELSGGKAVDE